MKKKAKLLLTILDLPFKSILDERPRQNQLALIAWDINGYSGFNSLWWDKENDICKHCVCWLPLSTSTLYNRHDAVRIAKKSPLLNWHEHFSTIINKYYVSKHKLKRAANTV